MGVSDGRVLLLTGIWPDWFLYWYSYSHSNCH